MKLELNVKRFNNEDVIATSTSASTCHVSDNYHWKVIYYNAGSPYETFEKYTYDSATGKLIYVKTEYLENLDSYGINSSGWWHSYSGGAGTWVKCTDQSDAAHPIKAD